jgi:AraC family transcriptional regulator
MEQHITTIFATDTLHIHNLDCSGLCGEHEHVQEEIAHQHEIVLPRYGVFQRYDAFGCQIVDVNYLAFFNSQQPHEISHPINGGDSCTIINICDDVLRDMLQAIDPSVMEREKPFLSGGMLLDSTQQMQKHRLLQYLARVLRERRASPLQECANLVIEIEETVLAFIADMLAAFYEVDFVPVPNRAHCETVRAMQSYLNLHYSENLALSDIAAHVHYSPYLLCRIFKQQIGLTIHQYLARLRLFHALELLIAEPTLPVGDIALQLGFYSHSHFTAAFSQTFNLAPSDYRQQASLRQFASLRQELHLS